MPACFKYQNAFVDVQTRLMARSYSAESLVSVRVVVTGPILTFGAIPHVAAFPLANGAWLDIQQHAYLGRGLAGFKEFPWLVRKWPVGPKAQALISKDY